MSLTTKRVISLLLCFVMVLGYLPGFAFAAESEAPADEPAIIEVEEKAVADQTEEEEQPEEIQQLVSAPEAAPAVEADGEVPVDAAVIFSDLHTNRGDYKGSTVTGVMTAINNAVKAMSADLSISSVTSAGDAFSVNESSGKENED